MEKKYLIQRRQGWYVQVRVPPSLYPLVGKHTLVKTLGTRDIEVARRLRWSVVTEMKAYLDNIKKGKDAPTGSVAAVLNTARDIHYGLRAGSEDPDNAKAGWDVIEEQFFRDKKFKLDDDGHPVSGSKEQEEAMKALALGRDLVYSPDIVRISEALRDNLSELELTARKQTVAARKRRVEEFAKWLGGDRDIWHVPRGKAGQYLTDVLMKQGKAIKTTKDTLSDLSAFFNWSVARGTAESNPFAGLSKTVKETSRGTKGKAKAKRREWTQAELEKLFSELDSNSHNWAMSVIALYTGMRSNEIAETELADVHSEYIFIPEAKTESSVRKVPIHPVIAPLIKKLVKTSGDGYLIEGLKRGGEDDKRNHYFVKRFGNKMRSLGIKDSRVVFHSLRKNFSGALENAGIAVNLAEQIVGHAKQSLTYGLYSDGVSLEALQKAVGKVTFGSIDKLVAERLSA